MWKWLVRTQPKRSLVNEKQVVAIGFDLTNKDKDRIESLCKASGLDLGFSMDVRTQSWNGEAAAALVFGERANLLIKDTLQKQGIYTLLLPAIKNLHTPDDGGIAADRIKAFAACKTLAQSIASGEVKVAEDRAFLQSIKPADIADYSIQTIQALDKALTEAGKTEWSFLTRDGRVVTVLAKGATPSKTSDIQVTIQELLLLRAAMDVFKTNEVQVASPKKT